MRTSLLLLLCIGCVDRDLCAGHDGTCLGVTVRGAGSVDQLQLQLAGVAELDGRTPNAPGAPHPLPVSTALFLPPVSGTVELTAGGFLAGVLLGEARTSVAIQSGQHKNVEVTLMSLAPDLGMPDLAQDFAVADLAEPDDLAVEPDLSQPDLSKPDLIGVNWRYVFLLHAHDSALGSHATVDGLCAAAAAAAGLPGTPYRAVIAYPPLDEPVTYLSLTEHRDIVLPDSTKVATDDDFFSTTIHHLHGIDQLADGTTVASGCAYSNFNFAGSRINSPSDCSGWSSASSSFAGDTGDVKASDTHWSFQTPILNCDQLSCHVYCIQQ